MKKSVLAAAICLLLTVGPMWLTANFAGSAGMAICLVLFFVFYPTVSVACGIFAGKDMCSRWALPLFAAGCFPLGAWLCFSPEEPAFLLYGACYLVLGTVAMLGSAFWNRKK